MPGPPASGAVAHRDHARTPDGRALRPRAAASRCRADRLRGRPWSAIRTTEFASVGLFVTCGDGRLLRRLLLAGGRPAAELDGDDLACRLMAHALLHRYSSLRWYLGACRCRARRRWRDLARAWWGTPARWESVHGLRRRADVDEHAAGGPFAPQSGRNGTSRRQRHSAWRHWRVTRIARGAVSSASPRAAFQLAPHLTPMTDRRGDAERPRGSSSNASASARRYRAGAPTSGLLCATLHPVRGQASPPTPRGAACRRCRRRGAHLLASGRARIASRWTGRAVRPAAIAPRAALIAIAVARLNASALARGCTRVQMRHSRARPEPAPFVAMRRASPSRPVATRLAPRLERPAVAVCALAASSRHRRMATKRPTAPTRRRAQRQTAGMLPHSAWRSPRIAIRRRARPPALPGLRRPLDERLAFAAPPTRASASGAAR